MRSPATPFIVPAWLVLAALLPAAATATPAPGSGLACSSTAAVSSGTVLDTSKGSVDANGTYVLDPTPLTTIHRKTYSVATTAATLSFGGFTYTVTPETIFDLSCSGPAGGTASDPLIDVDMGTISVVTGGKPNPGTLGSPELLLDPYNNVAMTMSLTRTPKGHPTFAKVLATGPASFRFGTSRAGQPDGDGYLNITPYIGKAHQTNGLCHQADGATITSKSLSHGYLVGKVAYQGLASSSPR